MDSIKFKYRLDRRTKIITALFLLIIAAGVALMFYKSGGSYLPAWFTTLVAALVLLAMLSIPRFILVSPHSLEIHCVLQLVKMPIKDIRSIRFIEPGDMRFSIPIWGIYGVFGYYGYYWGCKQRRLFRLYASRWRNLVLIEDVQGHCYVISSQHPSELISQIEKYR
jgi:hypothetical protein